MGGSQNTVEVMSYMGRILCKVRRLAVLALAMGAAAGAWAGPIEHVIIVSLDGARPGDLQEVAATNIQAMAAKGAYSWTAQTIEPSVTMIAHSSMLTGCQPAKHGVDWNGYQPTNYVKTSTCFELVKKDGGSTAMLVSKNKLISIAKPGTVDKFWCIKKPATVIAESAVAFWTSNRPTLFFIHFTDPDGAGHLKKWGSPEYKESLLVCDQAVGMLVQEVNQSGLAGRTLFIVTADHGGTGTNHGTT